MVLVAAGAVGCQAPDPAPTELDELLHFFWSEYGADTDQRLSDGVRNLRRAWEEDTDGQGTEGSATVLSSVEVAQVGMDPQIDRSSLFGAFLFVELPCELAQIEALYLFPDQRLLFPDSYDAYERDYGAGADCFDGGGCHRIWWTIEVETRMAGLIRSTYSLESGLRRLPATDQLDEVLMSRTHMPEPAQVGDGGGAFFDQTYQIEVFHEHRAGATLHLYGIWNSGGLGSVGSGGAFWQQQYLDGIRDWDARLAELCGMEDPFSGEE
jgi:hypothetical protein